MARSTSRILLVVSILVALPVGAYCVLTDVDVDDFPHSPMSTIEHIAELASIPSVILEIPIYRSCESLLRFLTRQQGGFTGLKEKALEWVFGGTWWLLCSLQWFALIYFPMRAFLRLIARRRSAGEV